MLEAYTPLVYEDILYKAEKEVKKPLSFNLEAEAIRAQEALQAGSEISRKLARDGFVNNALYWAREYVGDIKTTHYYWEIEEKDDSVRLYHPQFGYADDMERNAIEDDSIPKFEKKRRIIEHEVGQNLTKALKDSQAGDTFIWMSPSPEGVESEIYGGYTMGHLYEIKEVAGKKILAGRDIKNSLTNENHKLLLEGYAKQPLFENTPTSNEILGTLVKPERGVSSLQVEQSIRVLEKGQDPIKNSMDRDNEERKVKMFEQTLERYKHRYERMYSKLEQVYLNKGEITQEFKDIAQDIFVTFESNVMMEGNDMTKTELQTFMQFAVSRYQQRVGGGSCGDGVGFDGDMSSQYESVFGYAPLMVSSGVYSVEDKHGGLEFPCQHCRKVNKRPYGKLLDVCGEGQIGGCGRSVRC
jgi:hypothetical protein